LQVCFPNIAAPGGTAILDNEIFKSVRESGQFRRAEKFRSGWKIKSRAAPKGRFWDRFNKLARTYAPGL
jgi:hypothetical protein